MATINQQIFSEITGFEGSWEFGSADQDDYQSESVSELTQRAIDTFDGLDYDQTSEFKPGKVARAVYEFVRLDSGQSIDYDEIYINLE